MTVCVLAILEVFAMVIVSLIDKDDFFDHSESVYERFNEKDFARFTSAEADPLLGWRNYGPRIKKGKDCDGNPVSYQYDAAGARTYTGFEAEEAKIIVVGDSYTNSSEVNDDQAYPARLAALLGASVASHGTEAFGPVQSTLNFERNLSRYPRAQIAVLTIMYENVYRMMNSYRPVLYDSSSEYLLKPYMADGELIHHPGVRVLENLSEFRVEVDKAFDADYWAKPVADFPYLVSLIKSMGTQYFVYRKLQRQFRNLGIPEYFLIYRSSDIELNLVGIINRFAESALQAGVKPVAVFVPRNRYDTTSASIFIEENREKMDSRLLLGDVGRHPGTDWVAFNLQEKDSDNLCHPSVYGYQTIAEYIAVLLRSNGAWPAE